jgi:hypothetical protein
VVSSREIPGRPAPRPVARVGIAEDTAMVTTSYLCPCLACRHLQLSADGPRRLACVTFPRGIPGLMLGGIADHRYPVPGDGGVRFEPADDVPAEVLGMLADES